jgi:membrane protease YdiL (CAAX protease family)
MTLSAGAPSARPIARVLLGPWPWIALLALAIGSQSAARRGALGSLSPSPERARAAALEEHRAARLVARLDAFEREDPAAQRLQTLLRAAMGIAAATGLLVLSRRRRAPSDPGRAASAEGAGAGAGARLEEALLGPRLEPGPLTIADVGRAATVYAATLPLAPLVVAHGPFAGAVGAALAHGASTLVTLAAVLAIVLAHGRGLAPLGLSSASARRGLREGLLLYPLAWCVVEVARLATEVWLRARGAEMPSHPLMGLIIAGPSEQRATLAALALAVAPLCEETAFRGLLQPALGAHLPRAAALAITATLFAAIHDAAHAPPLLALGLVLGIARERTGSLLAPLAIHALFNAGEVLRGLALARAAGA